MINILEILKKLPNLKDKVFYSPLFGDVTVSICLDYNYKIQICKLNTDLLTYLDDYGMYMKDCNGECMLYPSRHNRDWSTFKISRKDLPRGTSVMVSEGTKVWSLRKYSGKSRCFFVIGTGCPASRAWEYIIPVDKFNFDDWAFKEEDNYGTTHKE